MSVILKNSMRASAVLLLAMAVGCSNGNTDPGDGETSSKTSPPVLEEASEQTLELTIQMESFGDTATEGQVLDILQEETNTVIEPIWVPFGDYDSRFNIQLSSGDIPDIIATVPPAGQLFSSQVIQAIHAGVFHDLTPYIEDPEFATKYPNLAKYSDQVWENIRLNGKIYAMPRYIDPISSNSGIVIRGDLLEKGGFEEPKTMDDLGDLIIALHEEFGIYGLATQSKDLDRQDYKPLAVAFTGIMDWGVDDDGNFMFQSFMPEYKDYLLWLKRLYDAGAIDPEFALEQGGSKYNEGKSAIRIGNWYGWAEGREGRSAFTAEYKASHPEARSYGLFPLEGTKAHSVTFRPFGRPALISTNIPEENIPHVLKLFDYTASDEYLELTKYGIEELHHEVIDGQRLVNDQYRSESVGHWSVMLNNYPNDAESKIQGDLDKGASQEDADRMAEVGAFADEKVREANLGMFHWSVSSPTYFDKWSSITRNLNDNRIKVVMGQMSIEEWDAYIASILNSADYQKIATEFKEGYQPQ